MSYLKRHTPVIHAPSVEGQAFNRLHEPSHHLRMCFRTHSKNSQDGTTNCFCHFHNRLTLYATVGAICLPFNSRHPAFSFSSQKRGNPSHFRQSPARHPAILSRIGEICHARDRFTTQHSAPLLLVLATTTFLFYVFINLVLSSGRTHRLCGVNHCWERSPASP